MQSLILFLIIYLLIGFVYAVYVTFWGGARWYMFPLTVVGGPITAAWVIYRVLKDKDFYL